MTSPDYEAEIDRLKGELAQLEAQLARLEMANSNTLRLLLGPETPAAIADAILLKVFQGKRNNLRPHLVGVVSNALWELRKQSGPLWANRCHSARPTATDPEDRP